jgi:hypothetical protein
MAACRKSGPLRETNNMDVQDGTMCRMTSPLPGPLRGQEDSVERSKEGALVENFSSCKPFALGSSLQTNASTRDAKNVERQLDAEKVA